MSNVFEKYVFNGEIKDFLSNFSDELESKFNCKVAKLHVRLVSGKDDLEAGFVLRGYEEEEEC